MTVEVQIFAKNVELTEAIRDYITKKVAKLDRFMKKGSETRFDITFSKTARNANERNSAQITLRGPGFILRAEERSDDMYAAIDLVMDKILRQVERYKGKQSRNHQAGPDLLMELHGIEQPAEKYKIVRRKHFKISPMNEVDAIEQMNLLGHEDFFIFFNNKTNKINIAYRRRDGNYGLIEPELE